MTWRLAGFLAIATALHVLFLAVLPGRPPIGWTPAKRPVPRPIELAYLSSFDSKAPHERSAEDKVIPPKEEKKPPLPDGQIVELPAPLVEEEPDEADYLAEQARVVTEETRSERFKINPEILSPQYSDESKLQIKQNNVPDLGFTKPADGGMVGNNAERFKADRHGRLAALPGRWSATNLPGLNDPVPSSPFESILAGAPQNDLLTVKRGEQTKLKTKAFQFSSYLNQIRRLVNFYWEQNLDNVGPDVKLVKPHYTTVVMATLNADGTLGEMKVSEASGSVELDEAITKAFVTAAPFPKPPDGLVQDGTAILPQMSFTVELGKPVMQYQAIDPRSGVQFPGILKTPR
jgi:TonB family protein